MARGFPSMTALLALLAVAGYQNRDKLSQILGGHDSQAPRPGEQQSGFGGLGGVLANLRNAIGGAGAGGLLGNGLRELTERFQQNGHGDIAQSWVSQGPNKEIAPNELKTAIGSDVLTDLSQKTGLSEQELLNRLSRELPHAVEKYTPDGHIPQDA